jgi:hypothetical protein
LIKETFGMALRFEEKAFWEYESYFSRAIGFATNLPTLAKIEYGPDANYGYETKQTESYYYQHLFYLTDLAPGSTYHYRIKVKGSDGQFMASRDYTFTTLGLTDDIVLVPDGLEDKSLPYRLSGNDKKYLLTEDISAPNGGIVFGGNNVELDLGGHTIVYDNEPNLIVSEHTTDNAADLIYGEDATHGVRCAMWNLRDQKLFNGTIVQGANGGTGLHGYGYNPVLFSHTSGTEIAGLTLDYYGDSVNGICSDWNNEIHHNVVYDRGHVIDNRHQQIRAITVVGGVNRISCNSVRRCRQTGIAGGNECFGNEVYGDSFSANSFMMSSGSNSRLAGNKIFGLGYNPIGIGSGVSANTLFESNFIYMHAYAPGQRDPEYARVSGASGFRWQIYDDSQFDGTRWDNNIFRDNVVVAKAWSGASYIRALWVSQSKYSDGLRIEGNTVKVEVMDDDAFEWNSCFTCIDVNSMDPLLYTEGSNPNAFIPSPALMVTDNILQTNATFLFCGTGYAAGSNAWLYRNTFERISSHDSGFEPFQLGFWYWHSLNIKVIDSVVGTGVDLSLPPKNNTGYTEPKLTFDVGVTSNMAFADAATGAPLVNQAIAWRMDGGERGTLMTDANGEAQREWLTTKNEHKPGDRGWTMSQVHNTEITFTAAGYESVTVNIADIKGRGAPVLFGEPISNYADIVVEGIWSGPGLDANSIYINLWSRSTFDAAQIYRADSPNGPFKLLKTEQGQPPYGDGGLKPDTMYYYKVRLLKGANAGPMSETIAIKTNDVTIEGLWGGAGIDANSTRINIWGRSAFDAVEIFRALRPDGPFELVMTEYGEPPYMDTGLRPDTTYYYKARLIQNGHVGALTDAVALKTNNVIAEDFWGRVFPGYVELIWWCRSEWDCAVVYRADVQDEDELTLYSFTENGRFYDYNVKPGKTYDYKIQLVQNGWRGELTYVIRFTA